MKAKRVPEKKQKRPRAGNKRNESSWNTFKPRESGASTSSKHNHALCNLFVLMNYFAKGKVQELQQDLAAALEKKSESQIGTAMMRIISNMTMGIDMLPLSETVLLVGKMTGAIQKLFHLYCITYCKLDIPFGKAASRFIIKDLNNQNPLLRAASMRTLSHFPIEFVLEILQEPLKKALSDDDPYLSKTAAVCIARLFASSPETVINAGFLNYLRDLLQSKNPTVIANSLAACMYISENSTTFKFRIDYDLASRLISCLDQCSEWAQIYILESVMTFEPKDAEEALLCAEKVCPRLQHSNSGIVMASVRLIIYLASFAPTASKMNQLITKCSSPMIALLGNRPEIEYTALKNIELILQKHPDFITNVSTFFCKYDDPIYVKVSKLAIISQLVNESNIAKVLDELQLYSTEIDVDFVRRSVRVIGRCALMIDAATEVCVKVLIGLLDSKISYVVQEATIVMRDLYRKYPNKYLNVLDKIIACTDIIDDEEESKAALIWIIGEYAEKIPESDTLLSNYLQNVAEDGEMAQYSILTASMRLFFKKPAEGRKLLPTVLKVMTEEIDNPDLRDRGYMYWRMLASDPIAAQTIIMGKKPLISLSKNSIESDKLGKLIFHLSTLSSLTFVPPPLTEKKSKMISNLHSRSVAILAESKNSPATVVPVKPSRAKLQPVDEGNYNASENYGMLEKIPMRLTQQQSLTYSTGIGELPIDLFSDDINPAAQNLNTIKNYSYNTAVTDNSNYQGFDPLLAGGIHQSPAIEASSVNSKHNPFLLDSKSNANNPFSSTSNMQSNPFTVAPRVLDAPVPVETKTQSLFDSDLIGLDLLADQPAPNIPLAAPNVEQIIDPFKKASFHEAEMQLLLDPNFCDGLKVTGECTII